MAPAEIEELLAAWFVMMNAKPIVRVDRSEMTRASFGGFAESLLVRGGV